jgi:flavin reductase (DIM6/NTAB) family NADH-FMN oxidoreductase RutF
MTNDPGVRSPFARFAATLDYPLYVVTTAAGNERSGCLIGFASQCSIRPARFLACISKKNHTYGLALRAAVMAVHVVPEEDRSLAKLFGSQTGDEVDKFARIPWRLMHGVPVLDGCECWFAGQILQRIDLGDHVGILLKPLEAEPGGGERQLTFQQAGAIEPGHAP